MVERTGLMQADREQLDFSSGDALSQEQSTDTLNAKLFEDAFSTGADRSDFYPDSSRLSKMFPASLDLFDPYEA